MDTVASFAAAAALTVVQLLPRFAARLSDTARRRLYSASGGVAVAFVFLHLLPELAELRDPVAARLHDRVPLAEHDVFLLAVVGLSAFYGIEVLARRSRQRRHTDSTWVDYAGIAPFATYYATIGYLLWDQATTGQLVAYAVAMGLHFLVVDYGLHETHRQAYVGVGRWLLAAAVLVGWLVGWIGKVPAWGVGVLLSVFAGAVILVALKEELPAERAGHYPSFVAGAGAYAALLTVL